MPRVAGPTAVCRAVEPLTGRAIDEFGLGVIGSCTRLTVTPTQFYYRPGGGEGRTVYVDVSERKLAEYEGVVRPGCFDGVVPANGRLYWMPLACDCWQVHGTFSMAPRKPLTQQDAPDQPLAWSPDAVVVLAARDDWPMFRADASGSATVPVDVPRKVQQLWQMTLPDDELSAPVCAAGRVFVGGSDGTVRALEADTGDILWHVDSRAAVTFPPMAKTNFFTNAKPRPVPWVLRVRELSSR